MLQKLVESFSIDLKSIEKLPFQESEQKFTEIKGKTYKNLRKFRVPISRFTENKNNRIYSRKLWENVIANQRHIWEGSVGLAGHAEDEGDFANVMCVWSNLHIDESAQLVKADVVFVGDLGAKALDVIDAGGRIGFSTSGWGELSEDGKTVVPETYLLERVADIVLTPSQDVWGSLQDELTSLENQSPSDNHSNIKEEEKKISLDKLKEINYKDNNMGNTNKITKMSKLEEKRIYKDVMVFLNDAEKLENPIAKLQELTEIKESLDAESFPELCNLLEQAINKTNGEIHSKLENATKLEKIFETSEPEKFQEGLSKLATQARVNEQKVEEWKKISLKLQEQILALQAELNSRPDNSDLDNVLKEEDELKNKIREIRASYSNKIASITESYENLEADRKKLDDSLTFYSEQNKEFKKIIKRLIKLYKEEARAVKQMREYYEPVVQGLKSKLKESKVKYDMITNYKDIKEIGRTTTFDNFAESEDIKKYFFDMYAQYGKDILPIKEKILKSKTLQEASRVVFEYFTEKEKYPVIEGYDELENLKLAEKITNTRIVRKPLIKIPKGWE